jgi:hypothetical protein
MTCITSPFQFGTLSPQFSLLRLHVTVLVDTVHNNKMMTIQPTLLVVFAPAALLAGVLAQVVFGKLLSAKVKGILAVLCAAPALTAVLLLFPAVHGRSAIDVSSASWDGPASLVFHIDALSLLFALMGSASDRVDGTGLRDLLRVRTAKLIASSKRQMPRNEQ